MTRGRRNSVRTELAERARRVPGPSGMAMVRAMHAVISPRVTVEWGPEVYHYGRREFGVRDPDGHWVIFTERTDDPLTCEEEPERD